MFPQTSQNNQTAQNKCTTGNTIIAVTTLTSCTNLLLGMIFVKWLLHFCKFFVNSNTILNLTVSSESQWTDIFDVLLSVWKYCQFFTHELNTFLLKIRYSNQWERKNPKPPLPFEARGSHIMHPSLDRPTHHPKLASRSNQLLCHITLSGHTDRPTHVINDRSIPWAFTLCYIDSKWPTNNNVVTCVYMQRWTGYNSEWWA